VRQALRAARQADPGTAVDTKLAAIRAAAQNRYPTADVDDMLAEIERGYAQGSAEGSGP
jgi:uncharacterized membrane protein